MVTFSQDLARSFKPDLQLLNLQLLSPNWTDFFFVFVCNFFYKNQSLFDMCYWKL